MRPTLLIAITAVVPMLGWFYTQSRHPSPPPQSASQSDSQTDAAANELAVANNVHTSGRTIETPSRPHLPFTPQSAKLTAKADNKSARPRNSIQQSDAFRSRGTPSDSGAVFLEAMANATAPGATRSPSASKDIKKLNEQRWVKELSGRNANLSMQKNALDRRCADTTCERQKVSEDIKVAGVQLKTEAIAENKQIRMKGALKRGHFAEGTPVIYME